MREFQERRKIKKMIYSYLTLFLLLLVFGILAKAVWGAYEKSSISSKRLNEVSKSYLDLENRKGDLTKEIDDLKTDFGLETALRGKFPVVREGEKTIVIIDGESASAVEAVKVSGFWGWFKGLFE